MAAGVPIGGSASQPSGPHFDGPWVRSADEIGQMWQVLTDLMDRIAAPGNRTAAQLSYGERYTVGVRAAARWTVGLTARTPLTGRDLPAEPQRIAAELLAAEPGDAHAGACADGVRAWLDWLIDPGAELVLMPL
jgi:hypothetical protein